MFAERTTGFLFQFTIVAVSCFIAYRVAPESIPERWSSQQSVSDEYEIRLDCREFHTGKASLLLRSRVDHPRGFAKLMQTLSAKDYRCCRLHMSAYLKTEMASGSARLWLQMNGQDGEVLALDDMHETPVTGISCWTRYDIVLYVPRDAREISFGLVLAGNGQVWADDFSIRAEDKEVFFESFETPHGP